MSFRSDFWIEKPGIHLAPSRSERKEPGVLVFRNGYPLQRYGEKPVASNLFRRFHQHGSEATESLIRCFETLVNLTEKLCGLPTKIIPLTHVHWIGFLAIHRHGRIHRKADDAINRRKRFKCTNRTGKRSQAFSFARLGPKK